MVKSHWKLIKAASAARVYFRSITIFDIHKGSHKKDILFRSSEGEGEFEITTSFMQFSFVSNFAILGFFILLLLGQNAKIISRLIHLFNCYSFRNSMIMKVNETCVSIQKIITSLRVIKRD